MIRPCFLVIDREHSGSISTRKLVIESAKFNVITAYSASEGVETLRKFPAVDGIVIDAQMPDISCSDLIRSLRAIAPFARVIAIRLPWSGTCNEADYKVDTYDPGQLLALLRRLCPDEAKAVEKREEDLGAHE